MQRNYSSRSQLFIAQERVVRNLIFSDVPSRKCCPVARRRPVGGAGDSIRCRSHLAHLAEGEIEEVAGAELADQQVERGLAILRSHGASDLHEPLVSLDR